MIREATQKDVGSLVKLGKLMQAESPRYRRLAYSPMKVGAMCEHLIDFHDGFLMVGERDGKLTGALLGIIQEHWMSHERVANELAFYVDPEFRGLHTARSLGLAFIAWAETRRAKLIVGGASTGVETERAVLFYESIGFQRSGTVGVERWVGHV